MIQRSILIIHPDETLRDRLSAAYLEHAVVAVPTRQQALGHLSKSPPSLVVSHPQDFKKLLRDLDRHAPRAIRAVVCPRGDEATRRALEEMAAEGYQFVTLEDPSPSELRELWGSRGSGRIAVVDAVAEVSVNGASFSFDVAELGNDGLGFFVDAEVSSALFAPGLRLQGAIRRGGQQVIHREDWIVRTVRPAKDGSPRLHVGVTFAPPVEEQGPLPRIDDELHVRGLVRRAVRRQCTFLVGAHDSELTRRFEVSEIEREGRRLKLAGAPGGEAFASGDIVRLYFEFGGRSFQGTAVVVDTGPEATTVSTPKSLTQRHRRSSLRVRAGSGRALRVRFRSPLSGELYERPLLDLHPGGLSFAFDARSELFPPGLQIDELALEIDGRTLSGKGRVRAHAPLREDAQSATATRRCGVRLTLSNPAERQVLLDSLIASRSSDVVDGSHLPFSEIWELFCTSGVKFPDYPGLSGPHFGVLESAHTRAGNGEHGLTKTLIYKADGQLQGHSSGLRIYSKTWLSQHLVVRPGYHRNEAISQELVNLMVDYAEALEDVEYQRGLWRTYNRWTTRIYGGIVARMEKPGLTSLTSFTPCRRSVEEPLPPSPLTAHAASESERQALLRLLRARENIVRLRSSDLVDGELGLESLGKRYDGAGLRRGRSVAVVDGPNGPRGFALMEDITPGLFWAEWYGAWRMVLVDPSAPDADAVRLALIHHATEDARRRGRPVSECLAEDGDVPLLEALGFANLGKVIEWTIHRSLAREWAEQLQTVFERVSSRPHRGSAGEESQEAA